ncbi:MAG: hypothetical protein QNJ88_15535 [Acidimicrobiia bacterium]|nr:hypothetical protein [Acidimicrobiia bacterium]
MTHVGRAAALAAALLLALVISGCGPDRTAPTINPTPTTAADPVSAALGIGLDVYTAQCLTCHGSGEETELAPSMRADVLETFGACADQNEFVALGADAWPSDTYGDNDSPFGDYELVMNGYRFALDPAEIAAVNFWIRVELAGVDASEAFTDCGLESS